MFRRQLQQLQRLQHPGRGGSSPNTSCSNEDSGSSHIGVTTTSEALLPNSTSTRDGSDHALCAACATISLESLTPYAPSQRHKPAGFSDVKRPLSKFQANRRCPFCRLIVSIARADDKTIDPPDTSVVFLYDITSFALSQDDMDIRVVSALNGSIKAGDGGRVVDIRIRQIAQPDNLAAHEWEGVLLGRDAELCMGTSFRGAVEMDTRNLSPLTPSRRARHGKEGCPGYGARRHDSLRTPRHEVPLGRRPVHSPRRRPSSGALHIRNGQYLPPQPSHHRCRFRGNLPRRAPGTAPRDQTYHTA